ncbi:fungal-specific transcription factor domain-containing protein [Biscogniauxia mediterranea]|nr:fungal-specific transcription factor domain-containing protein [Biscogniauxia mediterranea]
MLNVVRSTILPDLRCSRTAISQQSACTVGVSASSYPTSSPPGACYNLPPFVSPQLPVEGCVRILWGALLVNCLFSILSILQEETHDGSETSSIPARSRVKCDESRPTCFLCRAAGLPCRGYEKNLFFVLDDNVNASGAANVRFRRPLFTNAERERMSRWLTSRIPPKSALWHISQLEDACEAESNKQNIEIHRGPFGVFRVSQAEPDSPGDASLDTCHDLIPPSSVAAAGSTPSFFEEKLPSSSTETFCVDPAFHSHSGPSSISNADSWNIILDTDMIQGVLHAVPEVESHNASPLSLLADFGTGHRPPPLTSSTTCDYARIPSPMPFFPLVHELVPEDAVFLLKHYTAKVVGFITPFRHSKTPWHVLFVPQAKRCLADLTIGEQPDHASLTAFYGTLAISALSLCGGRPPQSGAWQERAKVYHQLARDHGRVMLKTAYDMPKTLVGSLDDVEYYFLETEKFIRLRGLTRRKSRKVRMLHHCYAFQRIFYESTCVSTMPSSHRRRVLEADSCRFRLPNWRDLGQEMLAVKTQEEGENDLHLERPGIWTATLYPEIFGVPEVLVFLLSLVTRLGKEKDAAEQQEQQQQQHNLDTRGDRIGLRDFLDRARVLEKCIKQTVARAPPPEAAGHDHELLKNMVAAMQSALSIFFYRRIYDVDAAMLQQKVVEVRDCLLRCQQGGADSGSLELAWPAFIAACEAEDPGVQASFSRWFESAKRASGLDVFTSALNTIRETWEARSGAAGAGVGWVHLLKCKLIITQ